MLARVNALKKDNTLLNDADSFDFHIRMYRLFSMVNDVHTTYSGPTPLSNSYANLQFDVEPIWNAKGKRRYFVTRVGDGIKGLDKNYVEGCEIIKVDGKRVIKQVNTLGQLSYGRRKDEDFVRFGSAYLTLRRVTLLDFENPKEKVVILYRDAKNLKIKRTVSIPWYIYTIPPQAAEDSPSEYRGFQASIDHSIDQYVSRRFKNAFRKTRDVKHISPGYSSSLVNSSIRQSNLPSVTHEEITLSPLVSRFIKASVATYNNGVTVTRIGHLKVSSFQNFAPLDVLEDTFRKVIANVPPERLIVDIRGNTGGSPTNVELLFSLLHGKIPNIAISVRPNDLTIKMYSNIDQVSQFKKAGEFLTAPFNSVFVQKLDDRNLKKEYTGKVIVVTDSLTLSAGELYTLACKDFKNPTTGKNEIYVVGTDPATNGAGASTERVSALIKTAAEAKLVDPSVNLDGIEVEIKTAFKRFHSLNGGLVEHFGIRPNFIYKETKRDVLEDDVDLYGILLNRFEKENLF